MGKTRVIKMILIFLALVALANAKQAALVQMDDWISPARSMPANAANPTPIVVWHGLGDFCENPISMVRFDKLLRNLTGAEVHCLQIGDTWEQDAENGWLMNVDEQISKACTRLAGINGLQNGFFGLGLSQGGLFIRGLLQRCPAAQPMKRLISVGGPQQGVESIPKCNGNYTVCDIVSRAMDEFGVYSSFVQSFVAPSNYWHDSVDRQKCLAGCRSLPDLNNALKSKNATYKARIESLDDFVMVQFTEDTVVFPRDSEWFGYFQPGSFSKRESLQESQLYKEDWLGLKTLDAANKLHFLAAPFDHLQFTQQWLKDNLLKFLM